MEDNREPYHPHTLISP